MTAVPDNVTATDTDLATGNNFNLALVKHLGLKTEGLTKLNIAFECEKITVVEAVYEVRKAQMDAITQEVVSRRFVDIGTLPRHDFWGAGEADCPSELKAPNGELHTVRCKVCGDGWRKSQDLCFGAAPTAGGDARDAARWRTLVTNFGNETDLGTPGKKHDILIRMNADGCEVLKADGSTDFAATLAEIMDDEARIQARAAARGATA